MSHISVVHVPVKAIGKKRRSVFVFPKFSLSLTCFGPSAVLLESEKSGALVPTASAIRILRFGLIEEINYRIAETLVKRFAVRNESGKEESRKYFGSIGFSNVPFLLS